MALTLPQPWHDRIFNQIQQVQGRKFAVLASFVEFWGRAQPEDLLVDSCDARDARRRVHRHPKAGSFIAGAKHHVVENPEQLRQVAMAGSTKFQHRCTMMERSSTDVTLLLTISVCSTVANTVNLEEAPAIQVATLQFADLALPERGSVIGKGGGRTRQGISALECIARTCTMTKFIPYRDEPLTFVLQDAFRGRAALAAVATCGRTLGWVEEMQRTLRFAESLKQVVNFPEALQLDLQSFLKLYVCEGQDVAPLCESLGLTLPASYTVADVSEPTSAPAGATLAHVVGARLDESRDVLSIPRDMTAADAMGTPLRGSKDASTPVAAEPACAEVTESRESIYCSESSGSSGSSEVSFASTEMSAADAMEMQLSESKEAAGTATAEPVRALLDELEEPATSSPGVVAAGPVHTHLGNATDAASTSALRVAADAARTRLDNSRAAMRRCARPASPPSELSGVDVAAEPLKSTKPLKSIAETALVAEFEAGGVLDPFAARAVASALHSACR